MRLQVVLAFALVLLLSGSAGASSHGSQAAATASAYGIRIVPGATSTLVSAPPNAVGYTSGFAYPADGSVVTTGPISVSANTDVAANARSTASSSVSSFSLFGGEVTASSVSARATGSTSGQSATGSLGGSAVSGLTVGGVGQSASPNGRVALGDWGYAITLEQAEVHSAGTTPSYRGYVTGLDIHLTAEHGGLPAGSEILVGYAEAFAQAAKPASVIPPPPPPPAKATAKKRTQPTAPAPKAGQTATLPGPSFRNIPFGLQPELTAGPYVFPVYGPEASFTDTFGGSRGDVPGNWHHGDDIFAPWGAPVLACADGTIFSVGWNDVGGNRLWLRDGEGNEFYYAHLSAYSTAARNGHRVKAGEVIGFVGNTGDAEGTPYHLHFEVHPVAYLSLGYDGAVDPTPYLLDWQRQKDLRLAQVASYLSGVAGDAPKPGAILLRETDISQANGLDPASLRRALFAPLAPREGGRLGTVTTRLRD